MSQSRPLDNLDRGQLATTAGGQAQATPRSGGEPLPPLGKLPPLPGQPGSDTHDNSRCLNPKESPWLPHTIPFVGGPGITVPVFPCRKPKP